MFELAFNSQQERFLFISYVRVISMMLIVAFHSLCYYTGILWFLGTNSIYLWVIISEPIASFVCISGFLFGHQFIEKGKYRNSKKFFINKTSRLIIPYFTGSLLLISIPAIHVTWSNLLTGIAHLWFLLVLFELFAVFYPLAFFNIITKKTKHWNTSFFDIAILLFSFIPVYIWKGITNHHHILCIESTLNYLPIFLSGFYLVKYHLQNKIGIIQATFVFIFAIIGLFSISYFQLSTRILIYRIPALLASISLLIMFCKIKNYPLILTKLISNLDKHSMGIYFFNQIIIFAILCPPHLRIYFDLHPNTGPIVLFLISLFIPWFLSWIFQRSKYLSWFIGNV